MTRMVSFAVQFVDVLWAIFVLLGIEKVRRPRHHGDQSLRPHMPYTHSLLAALLWAAVAAIGYRYLSRLNDWLAAALVGAAVFSHWILDLIVHRPDLALYDNSHKVGLGLWNFPALAFALEIALLFGGIALYLRATVPKDVVGRYGMPIFGLVAVAVQAYVFFGPPPASDMSFALTALAFYFGFAAIVYWLEGRRS